MNNQFLVGVAISPQKTSFGPLMYAGRLDEGLKVASQSKFDVVELSIRAVDDIDSNELIQRLNKLNLKVSAIATGQACLFDSLCLSAENNELQEKAVEHFKSIVMLAKTIGSEAVIIGGIRGRLTGTETQKLTQYEKGVEALRECAKWADKHSVTLLIEPINRYEMNWIHTTKEGLNVLEKIGIDSVKLLLDTFHMNIEEPNMLEAFRITGKRLGYVHFADNTRLAPGQGQIDFQAILDTLNEMGYEGPIVVEALPLPDDETALRFTAEFWQRINSDV